MFHVEISSGSLHRARVFNLSREDVTAKVVQPWLEDRVVLMGDREWQPRQATLRILEGPQLQNADLSFGQGWANAERASEDVTGGFLAAAPAPRNPDAFVVETDNPEALTAGLMAGAQGRAIHWGEARQRLDDRDPEVAAVILVLKRGENRA